MASKKNFKEHLVSISYKIMKTISDVQIAQ